MCGPSSLLQRPRLSSDFVLPGATLPLALYPRGPRQRDSRTRLDPRSLAGEFRNRTTGRRGMCSGNLAACRDGWTLSSIVARFSGKQSFWLSNNGFGKIIMIVIYISDFQLYHPYLYSNPFSANRSSCIHVLHYKNTRLKNTLAKFWNNLWLFFVMPGHCLQGLGTSARPLQVHPPLWTVSQRCLRNFPATWVHRHCLIVTLYKRRRRILFISTKRTLRNCLVLYEAINHSLLTPTGAFQ